MEQGPNFLKVQLVEPAQAQGWTSGTVWSLDPLAAFGTASECIWPLNRMYRCVYGKSSQIPWVLLEMLHRHQI